MRRAAVYLAFGLSLGLAPMAMGQGPDPLASLAADVTAVLGSAEAPQIMLNETDHGVNSTRTLGIGDEYRDGWKLTAITATSVTLNKARDTRTVPLSGRRQSAVTAATPTAPTAAVASTNSVVGGSGPGRGGPRSLELQTAIGAGNVKQVLQMGGTAADALAAMQAQGRAPAAGNIDPATAAFVQIGERYGIAMTSADGTRQQVLTTPDFEGFTPTGPVRQISTPNVPAGATGTFVTNGANVVVRQAITPAPPPAPVPPAPR